MGLLKVIKDAPGFAKVTLQGPQGSGKSRTGAEIATTIHKLFESKKPVAFYDTESGSDYLAELFTERTGLEPLRVKTRSFDDLMTVAKECIAGASDILIVDSITHVWRELGDAYMQAVNKNRRWPKSRMDIGDIMQIKAQWYPWADLFLNSPLHIIVCGREGNEWGNEEDEETGKRELVQVGKKMKVEAEFGYEASLQIAMSARQVAEGIVRKRDKTKEMRPRQIINVATVLKDRFDVINGEVFDFPTGESFMPHLAKLKPASHGSVDTATKSDLTSAVDSGGFDREKRDRVILCEEVQGELLQRWPSTGVDDKQGKSDALLRIFNTRSWTKVESLDSKTLRAGLEKLVAEREQIAADKTKETAA